MALLSSSLAVGQLLLASGSGTCLLPAVQHGLRVFSRTSSFLSLTAPHPLQQQPQQKASSLDQQDVSTAFSWTFAPLARELTREAGGFEHRARWPLGPNSSMLLDLSLRNGTAQPRPSLSSSYAQMARHYSVVPHSQQAAPATPQQNRNEHTASAAAIELPAELQQVAAASWWSSMVPKAQPRVKGLSRKLVLRQINRKIISRVARRATIGEQALL